MRANLFGQDRDAAIAAMDDDDAFDRWMAEYDRQQKLKSAKAAGNGGAVMSQDAYVAQHARVYSADSPPGA